MRDVHIGPEMSATAGLLGHSLPEIVTCQPNTPLTTVLRLFVEKKKHRIYVTASPCMPPPFPLPLTSPAPAASQASAASFWRPPFVSCACAEKRLPAAACLACLWMTQAPKSRKPVSVITATDILRYLCDPNRPHVQ